MSDSNHLDPFRNPDGTTSQQGSINAGEYERKQGSTPAPQQSYESNEAYMQRINSGNNSN